VALFLYLLSAVDGIAETATIDNYCPDKAFENALEASG